MTTGAPAPLVSLALRLLLLSRWSRETGLAVVVASSGNPPWPSREARRDPEKNDRKWMPDEDSNLD